MPKKSNRLFLSESDLAERLKNNRHLKVAAQCGNVVKLPAIETPEKKKAKSKIQPVLARKRRGLAPIRHPIEWSCDIAPVFDAVLPLPPPDNLLYKNAVAQYRFRTKRYRQWLLEATLRINHARAPDGHKPITQAVFVLLRLTFCHNQIGDTLNYDKALLDILEAAPEEGRIGVIENDKQVVDGLVLSVLDRSLGEHQARVTVYPMDKPRQLVMV